MDQAPDNQNENLFDLQVDPTVHHSFLEASRWSRFIAIFYSIAFVIILLALIFAGQSIAAEIDRQYAGKLEGFENLIGTLLVIIALIVLGVGGTLVYLLFRFALQVKRGIEQQQQDAFNSGLKSLKHYFVIYGIVSLVSLLAIFIVFVFTLTLLSNN